MSTYSFALYDAFSEKVFGGSQAAVITDAAGLAIELRHRLAREIGMPATAFVETWGDDWIEAQFISTVMELPMCGHGTICLLTHMAESGLIEFDRDHELELRLPQTSARVTLERVGGGRIRVMLDVDAAAFEAAPPGLEQLLSKLGLEQGMLDAELPAETARGDFVHLVLPLAGLDAMRAIQADFGGIVDYCHQHGIETVATFCREVERADSTLHVRDFCPAVGVSESAAAGTTNAALTAYLLRHRLLPQHGQVQVLAEQGIELGRPSSIESRVAMHDGQIQRLQIGGFASRVMQGQVFL